MGPHRRLLELASLSPLLAGLAAAVTPACRTVDAAALVSARLDSPRATVEAFQAYLKADLYEQEYGCLSSGFRSRNGGISLFGYSEFRDRLAKEQPWYRLIASAEVTAVRELGPRRGQVELAVAGKKLAVTLVREDFFRIWWGEDYEDGRTDLEKLVRIEDASDPAHKLVAEFPLKRSDRAVGDLSKATVERLWKIDEVEFLETDS